MRDLTRTGIIPLDGSKLIQSLSDHIEEKAFPCVGGKSAYNSGNLQIIPAWSLTSAWDDIAIHNALLDWSVRYEHDQQGFRSFAVVFSEPCELDELEFERAMWQRLQSLSDKDAWRGQPYDATASSDPADPHFALSFGARAYFVIGMHPNASRAARRTPYPTLIFNLHDQFVRLRDEHRYEKLRSAILARDEELSGSSNPMLARHGEISEARQYSGRAVDEAWRCPFHDRRDKVEPSFIWPDAQAHRAR